MIAKSFTHQRLACQSLAPQSLAMSPRRFRPTRWRLHSWHHPTLCLRRSPWFLLAVLASVVEAAPAEPTIDIHNPVQGRFSDEWAEVFIGGAKSGYAHSALSRDADSIRATTLMKLRLVRAGATIEIAVEQETIETLSGVPLSFASTMDLSFAKMVSRGVIKNGKVEVTSSQFGAEQKETYDFPTGALMTWGAYRESILRGFKPGTEYTLSLYAPELRLNAAVSAKTVVGDIEPFQHRGVEKKGRKVSLSMMMPAGAIEMTSWVDDAGRPVRSKVPMPGLADLEIMQADQAAAVADFVAREVFMTTVLKAGRKIDRFNTDAIRYRLSPKNGAAPIGLLPTTPMQSSKENADGSVEISAHRKPLPLKDDDGKIDPAPAGFGEFTSSNLMMNLADPELIALAGKAAGDEKDPYALAHRLRTFVTDYVTGKTMNVGFATAGEVARTREGDCSEHAVLLAALGRQKGIPTRVVVGLAYAPFFGGEDDIFGYHMWTQFWIDGEWRDLDAALRESECSPARIVLGTSSLQQAGLADLSFALLSKIGAVDLAILEVVEKNKDRK